MSESLTAVITCPLCEVQTEADMPENAFQVFLEMSRVRGFLESLEFERVDFS